MAIQIPNPGTGNGATGDNEFVLWSKVKDNFSDQTNAASKLVGAGENQVPLSKDVFKAAFSRYDGILRAGNVPPHDCNNFEVGTRYFTDGQAAVLNSPPAIFGEERYLVETFFIYINSTGQIAFGYKTAVMVMRIKLASGSWTEWTPMTKNLSTYNTTTASGANVVVDSTGTLMRSTSSERYKDILAPLELDDARYDDAMALKPIVYRSTADADNPAYHYYSFSAEELGAYDPAFTLWRETETVTDNEGNVIDRPLAERQAEGININALLAMGHAIAIKQGELIKDLQEQIDALKLKLEV